MRVAARYFEVNAARPSAELWCCAGSIAHIEDIIVRRHRYVQAGDQNEAGAMPGRAAFDVGHFAKLILVVVLVAVVAGILAAIL